MAQERSDRPVIRAEGLELRPLHEADAGQLASLCNNPKIARMLCSLPHPCTRAEAEGLIARSRDAWRSGAGFPFAIFHRDDGRLVGAAGGTPRDEGTVEISYWLGESDWGRGYATLAVNALVGFLMARPGIHRIIASYSADNPASARVLAKAGLRHSGEQVRAFSQGRGGDLDCRVMELLTAAASE